MKKFLFVLFGVFAVAGAFAAGENVPTSKSYVDAAVAQKQDKISASIIMPTGYTALEYLESTGTQRIDTGISGFDTGDWEIYAKWMLPVATQSYNYAGVFSVYQGEQYNTYRVIVNGTDSKSYILFGNTKARGGGKNIENQSINQIHTAVVKDNIVTFDDQTYTTNVKGDTLPNGSKLFIFVNIIAKIYSVKVKKNGVLFADFIPARRDSDNVVGMYDTISGQFFTNSGTGEFVAGPVIGNQNQVLTNTGTAGEYGTKGIYDANGAYATQAQNLVDAVTMNTAVQNAIDSEFQCIEWLDPNDHSSDCLLLQLGGIPQVPAGYTQLEYIESTGTQWIDTKIYNWNNTFEFELTLSIQQQAAGTHSYFGGWDQWNSSGHSVPGISTYTNYRVSTRFVAGLGSGEGVDIGIRNGQVGTIALKGNSISWSEGSESFFDRGNAFTVSASPIIFAVRTGGNISEHSKFKLYGAKFWLNDTLVRNFIPARRNSDGVLGMYDTISGQFFTNSGTGEFIAGPIVYLPNGE